MNIETKLEFEEFVKSSILALDLSPSLSNEPNRPYLMPSTSLAYEIWCSARKKYSNEQSQ